MVKMKGQGPNRRSRSGTVGQNSGENIDEVVSVGEYLVKRRIKDTKHTNHRQTYYPQQQR
jgi:hypothetical protein